MITKDELKNTIKLTNLSLGNAEKDYILECLLFSISKIQRSLVFKGGTALYKFYNLNRFSEDLDFDLIDGKFDINKLVSNIKSNLELIGMKRTIEDVKNHGKEINVKFSIRGPLYNGSKESMTRVTLNLSKRERPKNTNEHLLIGNYQELPSFNILVLDVEEIAAEKIRCILTRDKPRDVYDLWFLYKKGITINLSLVNLKLKICKLKFNLKGFHIKLSEKEKMWKLDLRDLISGNLPDFKLVESDLISWSKSWT